MSGTKDDHGKDRWELLPWKEITEVVRVLTSGAERYGDENWKDVERARERYFAAALRHLTSWKTNEIVDPSSGQQHLAHAICSLLFLMWFDNEEANI